MKKMPKVLRAESSYCSWFKYWRAKYGSHPAESLGLNVFFKIGWQHGYRAAQRDAKQRPRK